MSHPAKNTLYRLILIFETQAAKVLSLTQSWTGQDAAFSSDCGYPELATLSCVPSTKARIFPNSDRSRFTDNPHEFRNSCHLHEAIVVLGICQRIRFQFTLIPGFGFSAKLNHWDRK